MSESKSSQVINENITTESQDVAADVEAIMKKYDRESNVRFYEGVPRVVLRYLLALFTLYCVYINIFANWETRIERASFVGCVVFFIFMLYPATKKGEVKPNYIPWYDIILGLLGAFAYFYFVANCRDIISAGIKLNGFEIVIGIIGILVTLEACRRSVGIPIVIVACAFIAYALTQKSIRINVYNLFFTTEGVIGTPTRACSTFIVLFVLFGAFLEKTGIADFFIQFANSICGRYAGGPAKAAVVASALEGVASGSSVANTVGSGSITIPMMKRLGYNKEFAGAVEAAASTGGQIMPPIMGAAAFLMADYVGVPYSNIVVRAILPAVLYFAGVFITVHLEAKKEGLRGLTKEELPRLKPLLKQIYLLLPLIILVYLVGTSQRSIQYAAAIAIVVAIIVSLFNKENRITPATASAIYPDRAMLATVWRYLAAAGAPAIQEAPICLCRKIVRWSGKPMSLGQLNICLDIFRDVGLLEIQRLHKYIAIRLTPGPEKADLNTSQTMQRLLRAKES